MGGRLRHSRNAVFIAVVLAASVVSPAVAANPLLASVSPAPIGATEQVAPTAFIDGEDSDCAAWKLVFLDLGFFDIDVEIAEEGWVWAMGETTEDKFRDASGVVTKSKVAHNDTPANHFSHDWNVDIRVDPGQEGVLSNVNGPNNTDSVLSDSDLVPAEKIELEWEIGITPGEKSGDGASPFLPRWVLPNLGDRVWTNGHWVFDCGHTKKIGGALVDLPNGGQAIVGGTDHFRTEIHPGRAIATMRSQAATLPGSGTTPVPVTATDLYIHGRGGFMVQQLECGIDTILVEITNSCPEKTTAIDTTYAFDVCLPTRPTASAALAWSDVAGPGDSGIDVVPTITPIAAAGGCVLGPDEYGNDFDDSTMLHVEVDLAGSGIDPLDVYSRKITAGWLQPPSTPLPHLSLTLDLLTLYADHEGLAYDGEFTFWWMGVDKAPEDEWHRLVNYEIPTDDDSGIGCFDHTNRLNDMDDEASCGNGQLPFSGPTWEWYQPADRPFTIHTTGFEQDCYDDHFGSGHFSITDYLDCHFGNFFQETANDWGNNDALPPLDGIVGGPGVDPLTLLGDISRGVDDEFTFDFTLGQIAPVDEDRADLAVAKTCSWEGEVPLAGHPFTCTIVVTNPGPGLPRDVVITDTLTTSLGAADYDVGAATFRVGDDPTAYACGPSAPTGFTCEIGTVAVGGSVTIEVEITPHEPGSFANLAEVSTSSTDIDGANDEAEVDVDVHLEVPVDIQPGSSTNPFSLSKRGVVTVAILTTAGFDATTLDVATACFGDAGDPSQRTCVVAHGGPRLADADKDRDLDLIFQFEALLTGIDPGDTTACLRGTTTDGIGFYGCDVITTVP
jgi:hypothetical protein